MPTITEGMTAGGYAPSELSQDYHEADEVQRPITPGTPSINFSDNGDPVERIVTSASQVNNAGNAARANRGLRRHRTATSTAPRNERYSAQEYDSDFVDLLDLVGMC